MASGRVERSQELFVAVVGVGDVVGTQPRPLAHTGLEILECQRLALGVGVTWLGHRIFPGLLAGPRYRRAHRAVVASHDRSLEPTASLKIGYASGSGPVFLMTRGMNSSLGVGALVEDGRLIR